MKINYLKKYVIFLILSELLVGQTKATEGVVNYHCVSCNRRITKVEQVKLNQEQIY